MLFRTPCTCFFTFVSICKLMRYKVWDTKFEIQSVRYKLVWDTKYFFLISVYSPKGSGEIKSILNYSRDKIVAISKALYI